MGCRSCLVVVPTEGPTTVCSRCVLLTVAGRADEVHLEGQMHLADADGAPAGLQRGAGVLLLPIWIPLQTPDLSQQRLTLLAYSGICVAGRKGERERKNESESE